MERSKGFRDGDEGILKLTLGVVIFFTSWINDLYHWDLYYCRCLILVLTRMSRSIKVLLDRRYNVSLFVL